MSILLDIMGPRRGFGGGLFLPDFKKLSAKRQSQRLSPTGPLQIPLRVRGDFPTTSVVQPGDIVERGELLSRPDSLNSIPIYAPTSGRIEAFQIIETVADGPMPGVVLLPDGRDQLIVKNPDQRPDSSFARLQDRGVMCPGMRLPAHVVLQRAVAAGVTDLVINGMETEPYLTADLRTLVEEPGLLIDTICEIADAIGSVNVILAVPYRHRRVVKRLEAEAAGRYIEVAALSDKYPQCHPTVLVKTLLDREVPPGGDTLDVETLVLPLATIRSAGHAIWHDEPATHVLMTVAGDAVDHAGTYRVAVGTSFRELADRVGLVQPVKSAVWGGPLTGRAVNSDRAVVTADTIALLLFADRVQSNSDPCIHCGWCVEDCPVGLSPTSLIDLSYQRRSLTYSAEVNACIDCGLCSYVCPSKLPLAQSILESRERLTIGIVPSGDGGSQKQGPPR